MSYWEGPSLEVVARPTKTPNQWAQSFVDEERGYPYRKLIFSCFDSDRGCRTLAEIFAIRLR